MNRNFNDLAWPPRYIVILGSAAPTFSQLRYLRMFAVAVWHRVGFLLEQRVCKLLRRIARILRQQRGLVERRPYSRPVAP